MAAGAAGATAAAAAERRRLQEEEEMTAYSQEELQGWEFKIVRANTSVFGKPEVLNKLIQEEARAGWALVEKFDDQRIRFKRPVSARQNDGQLPPDVNPYRTHYGMSTIRFTLLILAAALLGVCAIMTITFGLTGMFVGSGLTR
jgi:hypothetical protein